MPKELRIYSDIVIFGIRVVFESDDESALALALGLYEGSSDSPCGGVTASIYVVLSAYTVNETTNAPFARIAGDQLQIAKDGIALRADGSIGRGRCAWTRDGVCGAALAESINTVVLFLIAHAGRIPVHAAAVMLGETAIVLAGRSGSGKSSLALAAHRAGLPILSEDTLYVQTDPQLRLWSLTQAIHVAEKPAEVMEGAMRYRSGRWKHAINIASPRHWAEQSVLCLLAPGERAGLQRIGTEEAVAALTAKPEPGYEFYGERSAHAIRAVAQGGCWRLSLSRNPDEAIAALLTCASLAT